MTAREKVIQREYQGLSDRTQHLLQSSESLFVDFKRALDGVKSRDLIAFANSPTGGVLLVGVDETTSDSGVQRGEIVGCDVDDRSRLTLINRAADCSPAVDIELYIENLADKPIFRIEVPSGRQKPYCTQRGEYSIRIDGRNRPLYPDELLAIFMDREGEQFISRFRDAVMVLEDRLGDISKVLSDGLEDVIEDVAALNSRLEGTTNQVTRFTDSNKKRSRDLLQLLRENREILSVLEERVSSNCDILDSPKGE